MEETIKNLTEETVDEAEMVEKQDEGKTKDPIKEAIESQMKKLHRQAMLLGAQTLCQVILDKITTAMNKPGKRTMNDYKRIIKDIESFCNVGLSRKVNADGETESLEQNSTKEETIQN